MIIMIIIIMNKEDLSPSLSLSSSFFLASWLAHFSYVLWFFFLLFSSLLSLFLTFFLSSFPSSFFYLLFLAWCKCTISYRSHRFNSLENSTYWVEFCTLHFLVLFFSPLLLLLLLLLSLLILLKLLTLYYLNLETIKQDRSLKLRLRLRLSLSLQSVPSLLCS